MLITEAIELAGLGFFELHKPGFWFHD